MAVFSARFSTVSFYTAEISQHQHIQKSIFTLISYRLIKGAGNRINGKLRHGAEVGGTSVKQQQGPIKVSQSHESTGRHLLHAGGNQDILRPQEACLTSALPFLVLPHESQTNN